MLETYSLSDTGCIRPNNEDYCRVIPEIGLFLLAVSMNEYIDPRSRLARMGA